MIGNQGILTAIFPLVLYEAKLPKELRSFDKSSLTDIYIKAWGKNSDENYDQSLPGKLLAKENYYMMGLLW